MPASRSRPDRRLGRAAGALVAHALLSIGCCFAAEDHGRGTETVSCTPGQPISVGCDRNVGTNCTGLPTLIVCDGAAGECPPPGDVWSVAGHSDPRVLGSHPGPASGGFCPVVHTTCPESGTLIVRPAPSHTEILAASPYTCSWDVAPRTP